MTASRSLLRDLALLLLALVTLAAAAYVLTRDPGAPVRADAAAPVAPGPQTTSEPAARALLVGAEGDLALAEALEEELGWQVTPSVVAGSGFIAGGDQSYVARVPELLQRAQADVVVLSTGTAEGEAVDLRRLGANVAFVLNAVREALPQARVVLVGPIATQSYGETRGHLATVAARWGAFLVDPIGRGYPTADPALLEPDGTLGLRGRQEVARLLTTDLARVLPVDLLPGEPR